MNKFKDLKVWQNSIELIVQIYDLTAKLPASEKYGLQSQINRCAISIPSNIAEGAGRSSNNEYAYFLSIAIGSSYELETQLIIGSRLKYFEIESIQSIFDDLNAIQRMLLALRVKRKQFE